MHLITFHDGNPFAKNPLGCHEGGDLDGLDGFGGFGCGNFGNDGYPPYTQPHSYDILPYAMAPAADQVGQDMVS